MNPTKKYPRRPRLPRRRRNAAGFHRGLAFRNARRGEDAVLAYPTASARHGTSRRRDRQPGRDAFAEAIIDELRRSASRSIAAASHATGYRAADFSPTSSPAIARGSSFHLFQRRRRSLQPAREVAERLRKVPRPEAPRDARAPRRERPRRHARQRTLLRRVLGIRQRLQDGRDGDDRATRSAAHIADARPARPSAYCPPGPSVTGCGTAPPRRRGRSSSAIREVARCRLDDSRCATRTHPFASEMLITPALSRLALLADLA